MLQPRPRLDPDGYYQRLGLEPAATRTAIVSAFRAKARVLHPDVPQTGNTSAFVAVKQAYDVLSNVERRAAYDRAARAALDPVAHERIVPRRPAAPPSRPVERIREPRSFDVPIAVWVGLGAFLCLCVYQVAAHLRAPPVAAVHETITANAASVAPLSASAHEAILYGPTPVRLSGNPNFYVLPAASPAVLWRLDTEHNTLVPLGQLPPFSSVQAVRLIRQMGMVEVLVNEQGNGFLSADHLTPGNAVAARQAYCGYNSGPMPHDGETLERHGSGRGTLELENRAVQPAVVKLRDGTGVVALAFFLGPGGRATFDGLPEGTYQTEYAIGELWSRACNSFAAGMRARRVAAALMLAGDSHLVVAPDAGEPASADIPDQVFERR